MRKQPAAEPLHRNKTDILPRAQLHKLFFRIRRQIAKRELQCLIKPGLHRLPCNMQPMVCDTDMADHALLFGAAHRLIQPAFIPGHRARRGIMKLVQVDIIRAQHAKAFFKIRKKAVCIGRHGFRCNRDLGAYIMQRISDLFFAVRISACSIKKCDARAVCFLQQQRRLLFGNALNGQCAECVLHRFDAAAAERYLFHFHSSAD